MRIVPQADATVVRAQGAAPAAHPATWDEYCNRVRDMRSALGGPPGGLNPVVDLIMTGLELVGLVGALDRFLREQGYAVFSEDDKAVELLRRAAAIFSVAVYFQDVAGVSMLRPRPPGLTVNPEQWLETDRNFHAEFPSHKEHRELYEHRMGQYSRMALSSAAAVAGGLFNILAADEGHRDAAFVANEVLAAVEHMLVVNGFTAADAAILSLEATHA